MTNLISLDDVGASTRDFQKVQEEFILKLKPHVASFSLIFAYYVYEDTFHVIIETQRGYYEVWSFCPNELDIFKLASWELLDRN